MLKYVLQTRVYGMGLLSRKTGLSTVCGAPRARAQHSTVVPAHARSIRRGAQNNSELGEACGFHCNPLSPQGSCALATTRIALTPREVVRAGGEEGHALHVGRAG